jgi:hypothetical protein
MLITKVLETSVDLLDPNDIYVLDIDTLLISKLTTRYKNKCFQSILILEITKIIRRSSTRMINNRIDGSASVDVQFEVKGVILIQGEILHGCRIVEINSNAITAENNYAGIKIQKETNSKATKDISDAIFKILRVGQKIPVVIQKVRYTPNQPSISVIATPFMPIVSDEIYYRINQPLNPSQTDQLSYLLDQISIEEKEHTAIQKDKSYDFFKDLLYPYKVNQKYDQSKKASTLKLKPVVLNIKNMVEIESGIVVYPSEDNRYNKRFFLSNSDDSNMFNASDSSMIIDNGAYQIFADIVNKYILYLQALRGFVETYPTAESMQELLVYWKLCKNAQQ